MQESPQLISLDFIQLLYILRDGVPQRQHCVVCAELVPSKGHDKAVHVLCLAENKLVMKTHSFIIDEAMKRMPLKIVKSLMELAKDPIQGETYYTILALSFIVYLCCAV